MPYWKVTWLKSSDVSYTVETSPQPSKILLSIFFQKKNVLN